MTFDSVESFYTVTGVFSATITENAPVVVYFLVHRNGCIFKVHPLLCKLFYTATGVFSNLKIHPLRCKKTKQLVHRNGCIFRIVMKLLFLLKSVRFCLGLC